MLVGGAVQCVLSGCSLAVWRQAVSVEGGERWLMWCTGVEQCSVGLSLLTVLVQPVVGPLVWSSVVLVCYC